MSEEEILIALKEIHARYCIPASEQNYTDKDYACMQYEKLVIHLQKEIERLNNIINQLEKWLEVNLTNLEKEKANNTYDKGLKQGMLSNGRLIKNKLQELEQGSDK